MRLLPVLRAAERKELLPPLDSAAAESPNVGMSLTTKHKVAIGVCVLAASAVAVDRFIIGYQAPGELEVGVVAASGSTRAGGAALRTQAAPLTIADRLDRVARMGASDRLVAEGTMVIPAAWHPERPVVEPVPLVPIVAEMPEVPNLRMSLVIRGADGRPLSAIVNGQRVNLGSSIAGYTLERIDQGNGVVLHGVFSGPAGVLVVPLATNPDLPTSIAGVADSRS